MAEDLDGLIEWILSEIVFSTDGISVADLFVLIDEYYNGPGKQDVTRESVIGSVLEEPSSDKEKSGKKDLDFKAKAWELLAAHKDIYIGHDRGGNRLSLREVEALPVLRQSTVQPSAYALSSSDLGAVEACPNDCENTNPTPKESLQSTPQYVQYQPRIDVSQDFKWRTIAGHSVDFVKVPEPEWKCLFAIARARGNDITQSDLADATGLGKIMLSRGTSALIEKNYVEKRQILTEKKKINVFSIRVAVGRASSNGLEAHPMPNSTTLRTNYTRPSTRPQKARTPAPTEPKPGKPQTKDSKEVTFMSYDEYQRNNGVPGVYFDIAELDTKRFGSKGRPKKRMIALFKSERIKSLSWMRSEPGAVIRLNIPVKTADASSTTLSIAGTSVNLTRNTNAPALKRKSDFDVDGSSEEPARKKLHLDTPRNPSASSLLPSYHSPYGKLSSTKLSDVSTPKAPPSVVPSQRLIPNSPSPRDQYQSPYLTQQSPYLTQQSPELYFKYRSPYAQTRERTTRDLPNLLAPPPLIPESSAGSYIDPANMELEIAIRAAQTINIPIATCSLAVSMEGVAGNLCLFSDRKALEFIPSKRQSKIAAFCILISEIVEPPMTSERGSKPMELRIIQSKGSVPDADHRFSFLSTDDEFQSANAMRAKIVTIMTLSDFKTASTSSEAGDAPELEVSKPFQCGKCGKAWKNDIGLKYHQTKSQTTCNLDFDPTVPPKRRGRAPKKTILFEGENVDAGNPPAGDSRTAAKRSFDGNRLDDSNTPNNHKLGAKLGKDIILELLDSNGQVFPGDKGLWFGFMTVWIKKFPTTEHPVHSVCKAALALLIDSGHIQKIQFSFRDNQGQMRIGTLVTRKTVDPRSPEVMETKEKIKIAFPEYYVPPEFAPPEVVRTMLLDREGREDQAGSNSLDALKMIHAVSSRDKDCEVLDAELYATMSGRVTRRMQKNPQDAQIFDSDSEFEDRLEKAAAGDNVNDGNFTEETRKKSGRKRVTASRRTHNIGPLGATECNCRNTKLPMYSQTLESELEQDTDSEPPETAPRKLPLSSRATQSWMTWAQVTTYLQDPNTGSWSISPTRHRIKMHGRLRLPEPITYMQTFSNSAWNFRPFGHGVRPIFARPLRRTAGNPLGDMYQERIQNGFRPVIMPNLRNRMEGPAMPSKFLLTQLSLPPREEMLKKTETKRSKRKSTPSRDQREALQMPKRRPGRPKKSGTAQSEVDSLLGTQLPMASPGDSLLRRALIQSSASKLRNVASASASTFSRNPGLDSLPIPERQASDTPAQPAYSFLRFLDPNTCLEDSIIRGSASLDSFETAQQQGQMYSSTSVGSTRTVTISWIKPKILKTQGRAWMKMSDYEFEDGSFSMQGWFPSAIDTLKQLIPQNLDDFLALKQGRRAAVTGDYQNRQWITFAEGVESVAQWEQSKGKDLMAMGSVASEYRFINHTVSALQCVPEPQSVEHWWLSENQFNLETLPYYELKTDEDEDTPGNNGGTPRRQVKKPRGDTHGVANRRKKSQNMFKTRRLTALPADVEGILDEIRKHPEFAVEVAFDHPQNQPRKRTRDAKISEKAENRLIVAVVVIRTLTGGLNKVIDWVLVSKLFPEFTLHFVQKRWLGLLQKHKDFIERMGAKFQRSFLKAYRSGEVPHINYDNLLSYDWDRVVDWAVERVGGNTTKVKAIDLPASRADLGELFDLKGNHVKKAWRDDYFSPLAPVHRRMDNAASEPYTIPISVKPNTAENIDTLTVAKSWVRASVLTPEEDYNAQFATQKMSAFSSDLVKSAIDALLESKVLSRRNRGRPAPGRGFVITDAVNVALRKNLGETQFSSAIEYKAFLDAKFRAGQTVMLDQAANEGQVLAITNLQAYGRIRTIGKGIPNNKFGLNDGDYQTKKMDKKRLLFDIEIAPTFRYTYDNALDVSKALSAVENAPPKSSQALPLWYGISGKLIHAYWRKVVMSVLGTIQQRPAIKIAELERMFAPALADWEIRMLVDWLLKVGAIKILREGNEGWNVREWWWVIAGMI